VDCSIQFPRRTSTWYCSLSVIALIRRNYDLVSRVAESEVKCPTPTPTFPKFPTPTPNSLAKHEWSLAVNNFAAISNQWKSWCTARILCCNKSFQRNCTISTGIPDLKVRCKKWFNWTSGGGVGQKNPTPTSSVLSNRLRLHPNTSDSFATPNQAPTRQPCLSDFLSSWLELYKTAWKRLLVPRIAVTVTCKFIIVYTAPSVVVRSGV